MGKPDWLQQERRHDALVLKGMQSGWQVDVGAGFNQNTDAVNYNGTYYTPANTPATVKDSKGNLVNTPSGMIPLINSVGVSAKNGSLALVNPAGSTCSTRTTRRCNIYTGAKRLIKPKFRACSWPISLVRVCWFRFVIPPALRWVTFTAIATTNLE